MVKTVTCDVFRSTVYFCYGVSFETAITSFEKDMKVTIESILHKPSPMMAGCLLYVYDEGKCPLYLLWVESKNDIFVLMHECSHLAFRIFEINGVEINEHTQEIYANYHESWVKRLHNIMKSKKK